MVSWADEVTGEVSLSTCHCQPVCLSLLSCCLSHSSTLSISSISPSNCLSPFDMLSLFVLAYPGLYQASTLKHIAPKMSFYISLEQLCCTSEDISGSYIVLSTLKLNFTFVDRCRLYYDACFASSGIHTTPSPLQFICLVALCILLFCFSFHHCRPFLFIHPLPLWPLSAQSVLASALPMSCRWAH